MPRYIDADALGIGKAFRYLFTIPEYADGWNSAVEIIENAPTADVVPKSEVAREIFAEIEKLHLHIANEFDARRYAELKKKYTEDQK